ncbi:type III-A CRISPR-associated RAMP protein Csm5 [Lewinella sp. LCG006]|uniref:type III-A CRISPR-associated RAMP protein Csm5 n=1 Tax=Lewinella sp. LCG006 TaxID=3231911 RepID=UPI00345FB974
MSKLNLILQTLSPVHVGTGNKLAAQIDYIPFDEELAVIDERKIFDLIGEDRLGQWVSTIEKGEPLTAHLLKGMSAEEVSSRLVKINGHQPRSGELKEQLHLANPTRPTIPGSSLKGSVRTVLFNYLLKQRPSLTEGGRQLQENRRGRTYFSDRRINAAIFGQKDQENRFRGGYDLDANKDFMRLFRLSDFYFPAVTECRTLEIINDYRDGWGVKKRETTYLECIPSGQTSEGRLQVPTDLIDYVKNQRDAKYKAEKIKSNAKYTDWNLLSGLINDHTLGLIEEELKFWAEEGNPIVIGDYMDHLQEIKRAILQAQTEQSCVLRVGAASGWQFMTGGWAKNPDLVDDKTWYKLREAVQKRAYPDGIPTPKTRKLALGGEPLGFVKLSKV